MLEIKNVKVNNLREAIASCRNAMLLEMPDTITDEDFEKGLERGKKLVQASVNDEDAKCHDNFLTGIDVSFTMKYTQYITKQFQRYHWFQYVSSSSMMHKITKMNFDKCCNKYVSQETVDKMNSLVKQYNDAVDENLEYMKFYLRSGEIIEANTHSKVKYVLFMMIISEAPMGTELFAQIDTNYKQLQTIYHQRKNHKLKEDWGAFCKFVESLPYSKEFITGNREPKKKKTAKEYFDSLNEEEKIEILKLATEYVANHSKGK